MNEWLDGLDWDKPLNDMSDGWVWRSIPAGFQRFWDPDHKIIDDVDMQALSTPRITWVWPAVALFALIVFHFNRCRFMLQVTVFYSSRYFYVISSLCTRIPQFFEGRWFTF
jgi:hypothetical protein